MSEAEKANGSDPMKMKIQMIFTAIGGDGEERPPVVIEEIADCPFELEDKMNDMTAHVIQGNREAIADILGMPIVMLEIIGWDKVREIFTRKEEVDRAEQAAQVGAGNQPNEL